MLAVATAAASAAELAHGHYLEDGNIHDVGEHRQPSHSVYFHHDHAQYVPAIALSSDARHQLSKRSFKTKKFGKKAIKFGPKFGKKTIKFGPKFGKKGIKKSIKFGPKFAKKAKKSSPFLLKKSVKKGGKKGKKGLKKSPFLLKKSVKKGPKKGPKKAKKGPKKQKKGKKGKKGKKQLKKGPKKAVKFGAPLGPVGLGGSGAALGVGFAANGGIPVPGVFTGPEADIRFRLNNG